MAAVEATLLYPTDLWNTAPSYASVQSSETSRFVSNSPFSCVTGQAETPTGTYHVYRTSMWWDILDVPPEASISGCTLQIYGNLPDADDDFILTLVSGALFDPPTAYDYSNIGDTDFGQFNTSGWDTAGYNTITLNADGLVALNAAVKSGIWSLGLRSQEDINATAPPTPTNLQRVVYEVGGGTTNPPILTITYSTWPFEYPAVPTFPVTGRMDIATYSVIASYLTRIDTVLSDYTSGDGNINIPVANLITWTSTSEELAYDNATSRVTVTSFESTSGLTVAGDLIHDDLTADTISAVDATVTGDLTCNGIEGLNTVYNLFTDNEVVFSAGGEKSAQDDTCVFYMDLGDGDFIVKTRDDGQGGSKTSVLGDFSGM